MLSFLPGDVLVVNASKGKGIFSGGWWIKFRSWFSGVNKRSRYADHVVIVHHIDDTGTLWGIEGRPSSVGWVDCALYEKAIIAENGLQPKSEEARKLICQVAEEMLGTPYDWKAIVLLGTDVKFVNKLWSKVLAKHLIPDWNEDEVPGHVICSSYAALVYRRAGLAYPKDFEGGLRFVDPDDWSEFIFEHTNNIGWHD